MFAIAFDLVVADTAAAHPKGVAQAYADIGSTLSGYGVFAGAREPLHNAERRPREPVRCALGVKSACVVSHLGSRYSCV